MHEYTLRNHNINHPHLNRSHSRYPNPYPNPISASHSVKRGVYQTLHPPTRLLTTADSTKRRINILLIHPLDIPIPEIIINQPITNLRLTGPVASFRETRGLSTPPPKVHPPTHSLTHRCNYNQKENKHTKQIPDTFIHPVATNEQIISNSVRHL